MYRIFQKLIQIPLFSRREVRLKISKVSNRLKTLIVRNKRQWQWPDSFYLRSDPRKPGRGTEQG